MMKVFSVLIVGSIDLWFLPYLSNIDVAWTDDSGLYINGTADLDTFSSFSEAQSFIWKMGTLIAPVSQVRYDDLMK